MQLAHVCVRTALLAALLVATADALFTPRCLWSGLLGDLGSSSEESGERWVRDTSFRTKDSRVRRFLWTDRDVCDWMCKGDYGSEVRDVCNRCCPGSTATSKRPQAPSSPSPATAAPGRGPRSTVTDGTTPQTTSAASPAASDAPTGTPSSSTPAAQTA